MDCGPVAWTSSSVRPRHGRISASTAVHQVAAIELGRDVDREVEPAEGVAGHLPVGHGGDDVAAHAEEDTRLAARHRLEGGDDVMAVGRRRLEAEALACSRSRNSAVGTSVMPTVRSPWTFEWPRTGQRPAPSRPILPLSRQRLASCCTVARAVAVLGDAHAVDHDGALGASCRRAPACLDLAARQAGLALDVYPVRRLQVGGQGVDAGRVARG